MQEFRTYLQQEFIRRTQKDRSYSLRAFGRMLGVNHATLSLILSGKRKLTKKSALRLSKALNLSPEEQKQLIGQAPKEDEQKANSYFLLQQDAFASMSEWHFDAILELSQIKGFKLEPDRIAGALGISKLSAKIALETLERLDLLVKNEEGKYELTKRDTTNILDPDFSSVALRKYQKSVLLKSIEALEGVKKTKRDHTSVTMAANSSDLPEIKERIRKFRLELAEYIQRPGAKPNEVFQLQVGFFPLSNLQEKK